MARVQASTIRTDQILAGRHVDPPAPNQALIMAAQDTVQVIDLSIASMRHKGELPQTLKSLTQSRERLNRVIEGALGVSTR